MPDDRLLSGVFHKIGLNLRFYLSPVDENTVDYNRKMCHEAAQKMRVDPSKSAFRSSLQTTLSCMDKESVWLTLRQKARRLIVSGMDQGDERKRTTDEVSKVIR